MPHSLFINNNGCGWAVFMRQPGHHRPFAWVVSSVGGWWSLSAATYFRSQEEAAKVALGMGFRPYVVGGWLMGQRWEYEHEVIDGERDCPADEIVANMLAEWASRGYELDKAVASRGQWLFIFRRPVMGG